MKIHKASEDYLEAMLMMQERHGYIRSIDVAEHLGVTKPSVSYATKRLREAQNSGYSGWSGNSACGFKVLVISNLPSFSFLTLPSLYLTNRYSNS